MRSVVLLAATLVAALSAHPADAGIAAYPSSTSIYPSGPLPPGGSRSLSLSTAAGEREGGLVVLTGARRIAVTIDRRRLGLIALRLSFAHFVHFGSRLVPDALVPWDGSERATEEPNQPVYVQVEVPRETKPGIYRARLRVSGGRKPRSVRLSVRVYPVVLPRAGAAGSLPTSFHFSPESYLDRVRGLYGETSATALQAANQSLYAFLSSYRLSPASWGFGEPRTFAGYAPSPKWWKNSLANMTQEMAAGPFSALRIPISSNRTAPHNYIGGVDPLHPDTWCPYLRSVHDFWQTRGWLASGAIPYLYAYDEPGLGGQRLVGHQASVAHRCFPGARVLMTGVPSPGRNAFLWRGSPVDDVDIWAILSRRYYGVFTSPGRADRTRRNLRAIETVRGRGKLVWAYTYAGHGTPGFLATEPLSDPRVFLLWAALESIGGVVYAEGTTSYKGPVSPLERVASGGEFVLLYPGRKAPIPSARLEQIRDGIEDWELFRLVRQRRGGAAVRAVLGRAGLFSAGRKGVRLACTVGCDLRGPRPFAWPRWSHGAFTPLRIENARLAALRLLSGP
jgi:hypothetical protein